MLRQDLVEGAAQFAVAEQELPQMDAMPLEQVKARYHDGVGLPSAPRYCNFGRAEIVHPVMNMIRLRGEWSETVRAAVVDDFQEVIEHLAKVQKYLDNPPAAF